MINFVRLINFESHLDTRLEFGPYFNLIRGDSDVGKSSCMRAVAAVAFNRWKGPMRRLGSEETIIEVGSHRGRVIMTKSDSKNQYDVYKRKDDGTEEHFHFDCVNKSTPPIAQEILGLCALDMGGITDLPNFMFQLDKHYMLSEINGAGCTDNMVARVIDNVIGLGGMEDLITDVSGDGASSKRKLSANNNRITELRTDLHDEIDLKDKKDLFSKCNLEWLELKKFLDMREIFEDYYTSFYKMDGKLGTIKTAITVEGPVDEYVAENAVIAVKFEQYKGYKAFYARYDKAITAIAGIKKELDEMPNFLKIKADISSLEILKTRYNDLVDISSMLDNKNFKYKRICRDVGTLTEDEKQAKKDIDDFKKANPNCPTCGKPFEEEKHVH